MPRRVYLLGVGLALGVSREGASRMLRAAGVLLVWTGPGALRGGDAQTSWDAAGGQIATLPSDHSSPGRELESPFPQRRFCKASPSLG
jgi:hypothetical protein